MNEWGVAADIRKILSDDNGNLSAIRTVPVLGTTNAFAVWTYICVTKGQLYFFVEILAFLSSLLLYKTAQKYIESKGEPKAGG